MSQITAQDEAPDRNYFRCSCNSSTTRIGIVIDFSGSAGEQQPESDYKRANVGVREGGWLVARERRGENGIE